MQNVGRIRSRRRLPRVSLAQPAGARAGRRQARHGEFRNIVQAGGAEAVQSGDAVSAFVLVSRFAEDVRGRAEGRSRVRHRLLGHRAQPAVESTCAAAGEESRRRLGRDRQGQERRCQDPARARLYRRARRHVRRSREGRSPHPPAGLRQGDGALAQRYPKDDEAQIHYAIALNISASPADKTYANQLKGAAILEPIFKRQPQHPGVAHYLIHLYDYPPIAEKGLDAARRYAKIAPAAPHAQHMPSHIFTRVGYWKDSIASNTESARVAKSRTICHDQLHAMDYLVYAYLQLGQDAKAKAVIDEMLAVTGFTELPCRRPMRGRVAGALRHRARRLESRRRAAVGRARSPHVQAITHFARALGAARSGNPDAAKADIAKLANCATSCSRPRTPTGPSRSTSSVRSRPPGCCSPKANTTTRSRR